MTISKSSFAVICPKCSNLDIRKDGFVITKRGRKQRYQCKKCGYQFMVIHDKRFKRRKTI